jgi:hypothetical protein
VLFGESLETPSVLPDGVAQGVMVAVTASRRCCAAWVTTRSVGISWPFPAVQPHRQYPDDSPVCSQRQSPWLPARVSWSLTLTSCTTSVAERSSDTR